MNDERQEDLGPGARESILANATNEIALLRAEVATLASATRALASKKEVEDVDSRQTRRVNRLTLPLLLLLLIAAFNGYNGYTARQLANETKANTEEVAALSLQIKDCLDPDGTCRKEGDKRTGQAVQQIIEALRKEQ